MSDLHTEAALIWAQAHAAGSDSKDPVMFGHKVALVYLACQQTKHHAGDEAATSAAIACLSIRPEVLQALALLSSIPLASPADSCRTDSPGVGS